MDPAKSTSTNAVKYELCGDNPAVAKDSIVPSKLQGTINLEDLMPSNAVLATSSGFIPVEDPAIKLVISGLLLCSSAKPGVSVSGGNIMDTRILSEMSSCCRASANPRSANLLAE